MPKVTTMPAANAAKKSAKMSAIVLLLLLLHTVNATTETILFVAVTQVALEPKMTKTGPPSSIAQTTQLHLVTTLQPRLLALGILHACLVLPATREEAGTAQPVCHAPLHLEPMEGADPVAVTTEAVCKVLGEVEFPTLPCTHALGAELLATSEKGLAALFLFHALNVGLATLQPRLAPLLILEDRAHLATAEAVLRHAPPAPLALGPPLAPEHHASAALLALHALPVAMTTTLAPLHVGLLALLVLHAFLVLGEA